MLGDFLHILLSVDLFQNHFFLKNYFRNTIRVSNGLNPDQERPYVGSDLAPTCLQRLSGATKGKS